MLIIARGTCPQGLSPGDKLRGINCEITRSLDAWDILTDEDLSAGEGQLFAFPGPGSNVGKGCSFGQAQDSPDNPRLFSFSMYKVDGGAFFDAPVNFLIVKGD